MSEIALYDVLTRIGATPEEAKEAIADVASSKEVATKADLKELKGELEKSLRHVIMWICGFIVGYSLVLIAVAQLFIK